MPPIRLDPDDGPQYERVIRAGGVAERTSDRSVVVRGRVFAADGSPAPHVPVRVEKVQSGFGPITCFLGCDFPPPCSTRDTATSDRKGRFRLQMCRPAGRDLSLTLTEGAERTSASVTMPLFLKRDRMRLPRFRFWPGGVSHDETSGMVHWRELPRNGFGALDRYELTLRSSEDAPPVWFRFEAVPGEVVDSRVLEESSGVLSVTARTKGVVAEACGGRCRVELWLTSRGVPFEGAGMPPSRGATCFLGQPSGPLAKGCYLTDGDLSRRLHDYRCSGHFDCDVERRWVGIDLGQVMPLDLIVVRGCDFCRVSVSRTGRVWSSIDESDYDSSLDRVSLRQPASAVRARYVRVRDAEEALELSVWPR